MSLNISVIFFVTFQINITELQSTKNWEILTQLSNFIILYS